MSELIHSETPSPNWNQRQLPVSMVVMHYTGMQTGAAAIERLCDPEAQVSAHRIIGARKLPVGPRRSSRVASRAGTVRADFPFAMTTSSTSFRRPRASFSERGSDFALRVVLTLTFRASSTSRVRPQLVQPLRW